MIARLRFLQADCRYHTAICDPVAKSVAIRHSEERAEIMQRLAKTMPDRLTRWSFSTSPRSGTQKTPDLVRDQGSICGIPKRLVRIPTWYAMPIRAFWMRMAFLTRRRFEDRINANRIGGITRNYNKRNFPAAQLFRKLDAASITKRYVNDCQVGMMDAQPFLADSQERNGPPTEAPASIAVSSYVIAITDHPLR